MKVDSKVTGIKANDCSIFHLLCDCRKLEKILPPQISDWYAEESFCTFTIANLATIKMTRKESLEYSKIVYELSNDKNIPVFFSFDIASQGETCDLMMQIDADIPFFLQGMVKEPMQKVVNMAVEKIKEGVEKV